MTVATLTLLVAVATLIVTLASCASPGFKCPIGPHRRPPGGWNVAIWSSRLGRRHQQGAARAATGSRSTATALEVGILVELNDVRAAHGLRPLKLSSALTAAARQHTFEMLADGYFEHESVGGAPFEQRIRRFYGPQAAPVAGRREPALVVAGHRRQERARPLDGEPRPPCEHPHRRLARDRDRGRARRLGGGEYGGLPITVITTDFGAR